MTVSEAKGAGSSPLTKRGSLKKLLAATGAKVGGCEDLIARGLADGFLDIDREQPDREIAGLRLWSGELGAVLIERQGAWALLRAGSNRLGQDFFYGQGDYDAENVLGMVLNAVLADDTVA